MANFLGMAFGFGARDVGFKSASTSAIDNLDKVNDLLDDQGEKGSRAGKMWKGIGERIKQFNIASIAGDMRKLSGETGNLSNNLESTAVGYAQASKPIIASMNLTGKEAQKMNGRVAGVALSLNASADAVAETFKAIHTAGGPAKKAIDEMGMSEKEWMKVVQTTGVSMQDYVAMQGDMVASWGASPEQAAKMTNNLMAIGKAAKIGTSAIKGAKGQLDAIDAIFEKLPPSMARSADEIQTLMESTYKLAGAFKEMGETEEQAAQLGQDTAKMFAEQAVQVEKLYEMGGEGALDDSPLFKFLSRLGIGTQEARDIIKTGSVDVVQGVSKINKIFEKMGGDSSPQVQHALAGLNEAMGQGAAGLGWLAQNTDIGTKSLADMANMTVKGEDALKKYGKQAFHSGRTLQQEFDLAKEVFDTKIRSIARANVKGLVKNHIRAYREVGNELKDLGSDETWGPLMNAVSMFKQFGTRGLFMGFSEQLGLSSKAAAKLGIKFGAVFDTLKGAGEAFGPLHQLAGMFGARGLMGAGLAAGGVVGYFMLDEQKRQKIVDTFKPVWDKLVASWDTKIKPAIKEAWEAIGKWFKEDWPRVWGKTIKPAIIGTFKEITKEGGVGSQMLGALKDVWTSLSSWIGENWPVWWNDTIKPAIIGGVRDFTKEGGIGSKIVDAIGDVWDFIWDEFGIGGAAAVGGLALVMGGGAGGGLLGSALSGAMNIGFEVGGSLVSNLASMLGPGGVLAIALAAGLAFALKKGFEHLEELEAKKAEAGSDLATSVLKSSSQRRKRVRESQAGLTEVFGAAGTKKVDISQMLEEGRITEGDIASISKQRDFSKVFMDEELGEEAREFFAKSLEQQGKIDSIGDELDSQFNIKRLSDKLEKIQKIPAVQAQLLEAYSAGSEEFARVAEQVVKGAGLMEQSEIDAMIAQGDQIRMQLETGMSAGMEEGGKNIGMSFAGGVESDESLGAIDSGAQSMADAVARQTVMKSPIPDGPLANDAIFYSGRHLGERLADGFAESSTYIQEAVSQTLNNAVITTVEEYGEKLKALQSKKSLLRSVAEQMVKDFGGKMEMGSVQVEGEATLDSKKTFETALNIPGLGGVIAAIVADGHQTRVLLSKIREDTRAIAQSDMINGRGGAGAGATLPG